MLNHRKSWRPAAVLLLLTREPRRPDLLPEASVVVKAAPMGNAGVTEAKIRSCA